MRHVAAAVLGRSTLVSCGWMTEQDREPAVKSMRALELSRFGPVIGEESYGGFILDVPAGISTVVESEDDPEALLANIMDDLRAHGYATGFPCDVNTRCQFVGTSHGARLLVQVSIVPPCESKRYGFTSSPVTAPPGHKLAIVEMTIRAGETWAPTEPPVTRSHAYPTVPPRSCPPATHTAHVP